MLAAPYRIKALQFCRLSLIAVIVGTMGCSGMGPLLRAYGFSELRPPSTLLLPGAMVAVKGRSPFEASIICGPRASLGGHWKPVRSPTASSELSKYNGKSFKIDAKVLESVKADVRFKYISSISVTLSNASLVEISDIDIIGNRRFRSADCEEAIRRRIENGFPVTMVSSGLMGDVVYTIKWQADVDVDAQAKVDALQQLALELGGGSSNITERTIKAKGLVWGITDDAFLAALSIPQLDSNAFKPGTHSIPTQVIARLDPQPDAPVILPTEFPCRGDDCAYTPSATGPAGHRAWREAEDIIDRVHEAEALKTRIEDDKDNDVNDFTQHDAANEAAAPTKSQEDAPHGMADDVEQVVDDVVQEVEQSLEDYFRSFGQGNAD